MLKAGVFITPKAEYMLYEIQETGFYRIDFVRDKGEFMYEVDKIVYSLYKKKQTYTYGDRSVYEEYMKATTMLNNAHYTDTEESRWNNGKYFKYITGVNSKLGYQKQATMENGVITECALSGGGYALNWSMVAVVYGMALEPMNFFDYKKTSISNDNVKTHSSGALYYTLEELKRRFDLDYIEDNDFEVVSPERLDYWLDCYKHDPYPWRSFDTETTGTDVSRYGKDHMVGIVLGVNKTKACYIPFRHEGDFNVPMERLKDIMDVVIAEQDRSTGHNTKFDRQVMKKEGYDLRLHYDTLQIAIINNPVFAKKIHGLKHLTSELLNRYVLELTDIFINAKDINFAVLTPELIKYYACPDGSNSLIILEDQLKKLPKFQYKLMELECAMTHIIADQEYYGIRVDVKKFEHQYHNCNYILDMLLKAFRVLTKEDGNINSGPVMSNLLYNKMHCKVLVRTKTGQPSVAMQAIKKLASVKAEVPKLVTNDLVDLDGKVIIKAKDLSVAAYPALVILAKYREYNKLKTAFYSRFERTMKTGRVFFWVNQNGAATGRQSSPMHQLPPALKDCILADAEDRDFWGPDFSQVELRMIAYLAGETQLIELAKDPRNDIHRIIGSLITGKEMWEITPEERSVGKRRNFGVVYLISAMGLAAQIFGAGYTKENVEFCQKQLDDFYSKFKRINRYIKMNGVKVQRDGYMETAWFHRRRNFPEIFDPDLEPRKRASIIRMSNNVPVQGTAADLLKFGMVMMDKYIREKGWDKEVDGYPMVRMMLSIHDELIISALQEIPMEEIITMITVCMDVEVKDAPPFFVQPARMLNWGGHSDDAVAIPIPYRDQLIEDYERTGVSVFKCSYFKLNVPDDVKEDINSGKLNNKELVKKHLGSVSMTFDHGNYVKEYSEDDLKTAFGLYLESGTSMYCIDNYLKLLNAYRDKELEEYMEGLIKEYGMDYKVVGEHVRHPALTFELLNRYYKLIPKGMEHVDSITEAARLYIEDLSGEKRNELAVKEVKEKEVKVADKDVFVEQLEAMVNYDENGEVVFEDSEDEFEDVYSYYDDEDPDSIIDFVENKPVYVWEIGDAIVFDVEKFGKDNVNAILAYIHQFSVPDGFYHAHIIYNKLIDTGMRLEEFDIEKANELLCTMAERSSVCA